MFQFEGYTLDVARHSLRAADREVALRRKSFELLRYLVENPDRLVTKEELLKAIWPNAAVADESLTQCVRDVRQAIGDSKQTIIATVPRCGYRFTAPVVRVAANAAALGTAGVSPASKQERAGETPAVPGGSVGIDRPSVAVLPFVNLSGDPQQDYFSDGITEDIITELSRFSELLVIARNSSFQYKNKAVDIRQVGRKVGACYVQEGIVRRIGNRGRMGAQLIDAMTGAHRWAERYDRELHDVFAVQDEVARAIVAILAAHVNRAEIERALLKPPAVWQAYEYCLQGTEELLLHMNRRSKASLYDARRLLEQSLAIDPDYARAYAMLAGTYVSAYVDPIDSDWVNPAALDRAIELAETAVHLDSHLPLAHAWLGYVLLWKRQHDTAIAELERAFALNPNFTNNAFPLILIYAGEPARALDILEANMRLDPFPRLTGSANVKAIANYMLKRYGEAGRLLGECTSRLPNLQWPHHWLASAYAQLGQLEEARQEASEVLRVNPEFTIEKFKPLVVFKNPKDAEHLIDGLRKAGLPEI